MNRQEFLERLENRWQYKDGETKFSDIELDDINNYILKRDLSDKDLDNLYDRIIENHTKDGPPTYSEVVNYHRGEKAGRKITDGGINKYRETVTQNNVIIQSWDRHDIRFIIQKIKEINNLIFEGRESFTDREYLNKYDSIYYEYSIMQEENKKAKEQKNPEPYSPEYMKEHLEYVKEKILSGESFISIHSKKNYFERLKMIRTDEIGNPEYFQD